MTTLLKKMSSKSVTGDVGSVSAQNFYDGKGKVLDDKLEPLYLYRVVGVAKGYKTGEHPTNGIWVSFAGIFKATSYLADSDGVLEEFRSSTLFLHEPVVSMLVDALETSDEVEIAFDVGIKPCATPIGYEYTYKTVFEPTESNAILAIESRIASLTADKKLSDKKLTDKRKVDK